MSAPTLEITAANLDQIDDIADEMSFVCGALAAASHPRSNGFSGPALEGLYQLIDRWETTLRSIVREDADKERAEEKA